MQGRSAREAEQGPLLKVSCARSAPFRLYLVPFNQSGKFRESGINLLWPEGGAKKSPTN